MLALRDRPGPIGADPVIEPTTADRSKTARGLGKIHPASAWMLGGAITFATMGALVHALGPRCDWLVVATVRALVMFASSMILARLAGARLPLWRPRTLWVRSLAGSFSLVCNFYALARLPVAEAVTLSNLHPLWIVLITASVARRAPSMGEALMLASGLVGVFLIESPRLEGDRLAVVVALLSSMSTAVAMLGLHRLRAIDARAVVAHFAGVASVLSLIWLAIRGRPLDAGLSRPLDGRPAGRGRRGRDARADLPDQGLRRRGAQSKVAVVGLDAGGLRPGVRRGDLGPAADPPGPPPASPW